MLARAPAPCASVKARSMGRHFVAVKAAAQPHRSAPASAQQTTDASAIPHTSLLAAGALLAPYLLDVSSSLATGGEFGLLEGRTAALIHPIVMGSLFGATGYAGYLGWQWRRTRTIGDDIKALKAQLPKAPAGSEGAEAPPAPAALTQQISALEAERKELVAGGYRDKHWWWGALLLGGGVTLGVAGPVNTWMRTGKLFPGPHLFAGAAIVVLWALAAALVPAMQKGNDNARSAHIALNAVNLALFAWQLPTGWDIVSKVMVFTSWP